MKRLKLVASRAALAAGVLAGQLDHAPGMAERLAEERRRNERLRRLLLNENAQSKYWFTLWREACVGFQATQERLVEEIDRLRRKAGEYDGKSFYEKKEEEAVEQRLEKLSHPIRKNMVDDGVKIVAPPKTVDPDKDDQ